MYWTTATWGIHHTFIECFHSDLETVIDQNRFQNMQITCKIVTFGRHESGNKARVSFFSFYQINYHTFHLDVTIFGIQMQIKPMTFETVNNVSDVISTVARRHISWCFRSFSSLCPDTSRPRRPLRKPATGKKVTSYWQQMNSNTGKNGSCLSPLFFFFFF